MRRSGLAICIALLAGLYLYNLSGMGMVGPDEPRYAWISRGMAQSGDWLIPKLWDGPWYEKPPLLYWLSGLGFVAGFNQDLAPRLPVALLSLAFLCFFWWRVRAVWDQTTAVWSVALLSTSAGWLAYSHIAVTDLPLAAFFSAAVLLYCGEKPRPLLGAVALGLAVLAKGLVPLVLFAPVLAMNTRRLRVWLTRISQASVVGGSPCPTVNLESHVGQALSPATELNGAEKYGLRPAALGLFAVIAVPWFAITAVHSGGEMIQVLFVQQTFSRFASQALQHVQPWWFYGPVALLLLFPWFPLLPLIWRVPWRAGGQDARTLGAAALFGFVFFSLAVNKLPGYLLPLLPATCVLIALGLQHTPHPHRWLAAPLAVLGLMPALAQVVPAALATGLRTTPIPWPLLLGGLAVAGLIAFGAAQLKGERMLLTVTAITVIGFLWFESIAFPRLDIAASARPLWLASHPVCIPEQPRTLAYGLYYYSKQRLPPCP